MVLELDILYREIIATYSSQKRDDVVEFTKKNLQGEYKNLKPGEELCDVFDKMKSQGQISSSNPDLLKYFAKNAPKQKRKCFTEKLNSLKLKHQDTDCTEFVGRHGDVEKVLSIIQTDQTRVVNVFGEQGVGKTTMANKVAEQLVPREEIYTVDLQHARDIMTVINSILLAFHSPKLLDPRYEVVYEIVENLEKQSVVVLDNVLLNDLPSENLQNERVKFFKLLKEAVEHDKGGNLVILLTSPSSFPVDFVQNFKLKPLSPDNSAQLLDEICPDKSEVDQITQLCKNNPLYLQTTTAILKEKLTQPQELLINRDTTNVLIKAFELFSPDMKKVALQLSLFQSPFTVKLAATLLKCSSGDAEFYLGVLKNRHFLSLINKKYSMHSLAKDVLIKKGQEKNHRDTFNEAKETFSRVFVKRAKEIANLSDKDYIKMYLQFQKDKYNLNLAIKISFEKGFLLTSSEFSDSIRVATIAKCLQPGHERAELFRDLSRAALSKGEWVSFINLSCQLVLVLLEKTATKTEARDMLPQIETALKQAVQSQPSSSESYRLAESSYEFTKGEIAYADYHSKVCSREDFDAGLEYHKKCLQTRKELIGDHAETAKSLNSVGNCYMELQEYETALYYYTEAIEMRKRLSGEKEHFDSPIYMNQIACVHEEMGKKFRSQSQKSTMPDKKQLYDKAQIEFQQAANKFEESLNIEKRLHIYGNPRTATFYRNLSNTYSYLEQYDEAFVYAKKALTIRKKVLGTDVNTVRSYYQVAVSYEWLGDDDKALKYYYKAYNMENDLPPGERSRVKLKIEGKIASLLGDIEEAIEFNSRTDDEALTSGDEGDDETTSEDEHLYSDDSSSDCDFLDEDSSEQQTEPALSADTSGTMVTTIQQQAVETSNETIQLSLKAFDDDLHTESEIEECDDIHESRSVGIDGCCWKIANTGIVLCFEPNTVLSNTEISCCLNSQCPSPLDSTETLVSRVICLKAKKLSINKVFAVVIPHCGPVTTSGYDVVVKEFCEDTNNWKEVDSGVFKNIRNKTDLSKHKVFTNLQNIKLPSILLTRQSCGIICVVSRLVSDTISVESSPCTITSSVSPDVTVQLQDNTVKGFAQVTLKVHPLPTRLFKSTELCCGPVLELSIDDALSTNILNPVKVSFPHPLVWHGSKPLAGRLLVLYNKLDNDVDSEWMDITDDITMSVDGNIITMEITHFSLRIAAPRPKCGFRSWSSTESTSRHRGIKVTTQTESTSRHHGIKVTTTAESTSRHRGIKVATLTESTPGFKTHGNNGPGLCYIFNQKEQ